MTSATADCGYQGKRDRNGCVFLAFEASKTVEDNEFYLQEFLCALEDLLIIENFFFNQDEACNQMALCRKAVSSNPRPHGEMLQYRDILC